MNLIAIDIGAYSIKALALDPKRKHLPVAYVEELLRDHQPITQAPTASLAQPEAEAKDPIADGQAAIASPDAGSIGGDWGGAGEANEDAEAVSAAGLMPWQLAVRRVLERLGQDGDGVLVTLPRNTSFSVQLADLPFAEKGKVTQIMGGMLASKLPMPLDELIYDFFISSHAKTPAAPGELSHEALVGLARRRELAVFLGALDAVEVNPSMAAIPELTLRYLAEAHIREHETGCFAMLDMGHMSTRVHVMERGRTVMARAIDHGGAQVTEALMQAFSAGEEEVTRVKHARGAILTPAAAQDPSLKAMSDAIERAMQPLVRDLRRTFKGLYARDRVELSKVYIFGGNSRLGGMPEYLSAQLGLPVERLELELYGEAMPGLGPNAAQSCHAVTALAQQHVRDQSGARGVNLRRGLFTYRGRASSLRALMIQGGAAAALLLFLLGASLFMQKRDLDAQRDAMRAVVAQETKKVFGAPLYKADAIKKRANFTEGGTARGGFVPKMSAYEVLYQLTSKLRPETTLTITRMEVDADRNLIQIYGTTTTPQAVDEIVSDFEQLECLRSIKKDKLQVRKDDVNFELQIASACS